MIMKNSKVLKGILIPLGASLTYCGLWRLFDPIGFLAFSGILLTADPSLLNEVRGTGGLIVGLGLVIFLGAFKKSLAFTSTIIAILVFFGFGIGRALSVVVDGNPGDMLVQATYGEFFFGFLSLFALIKYREKS